MFREFYTCRDIECNVIMWKGGRGAVRSFLRPWEISPKPKAKHLIGQSFQEKKINTKNSTKISIMIRIGAYDHQYALAIQPLEDKTPVGEIVLQNNRCEDL